MIPRVAGRGSSFKGAGLYYLHDKDAFTNERVGWVHLENLATDDPEIAMRHMAFTAMHSEHLKHKAGGSRAGKKTIGKPVYTYSLSWSPEQQPEENNMLKMALQTLEILGLHEHESVIIRHTDTAHPHLHVLVNLVHPDTGKTVAPSMDYITFSNWAEDLERSEGKIYCEQRVINNELRRENALDGRQLGMVKHRDKRIEQAALIKQLFEQSDSGKAFQAALKHHKYTLANGDRRGYLLADTEGKAVNLIRQLEGYRTRDVRERFKEDLPAESLPHIKDVLQQQAQLSPPTKEAEMPQKTTLREGYENLKTLAIEKKKERSNFPSNSAEDPMGKNKNFLEDLDKKREMEAEAQRKRFKLEQEQNDFYNRQSTLDRMTELKQQLKDNTNVQGRWSGKLQSIEEELNALRQNLDNIDMRVENQRASLEKQISLSQDFEDDTQLTEEQQQKQIDAALKRWDQLDRDRDNDRQQDLGLDI